MDKLRFSKKTKILGHKIVERIGEVKGKGESIVEAEAAIIASANKLKAKKNRPNANWLIKTRITYKSGKVIMSGVLAEVTQLYARA